MVMMVAPMRGRWRLQHRDLLLQRRRAPPPSRGANGPALRARAARGACARLRFFSCSASQLLPAGLPPSTTLKNAHAHTQHTLSLTHNTTQHNTTQPQPQQPFTQTKNAGAERRFNVFFPRGYDAAKQRYPLWVHMHGVYWSTMGDISRQMGYTVPASDATPVWDTLATSWMRDKAVIVYPQATSPGGDMNRRTFWSLPFWHCSVGDCIDSKIDDVGYIEKVLDMVPQRVAGVDRSKIYLTGTSAGGMMLQTLLCKSSLVASRVAAAVDVIGGIGAPMKGQCSPPGKRRVPLRIIHGENDQVLRWDQNGDVDGAPFLSTKEGAAMWQGLYGCGAERARQTWADATTTCSALCGGRHEQLELCGMRGVGHDLNTPFQGYPLGLAWGFLSSHALPAGAGGKGHGGRDGGAAAPRAHHEAHAPHAPHAPHAGKLPHAKQHGKAA